MLDDFFWSLEATAVAFGDSPDDLSKKFKEVLDRVAAEGHGCLQGFEELLEQVATQSDNAVFDDFMFRIKDATTFKKLENRLRIAGQTTRLDAVRLRRFRVRKEQLQSKADAASALIRRWEVVNGKASKETKIAVINLLHRKLGASAVDGM